MCLDTLDGEADALVTVFLSRISQKRPLLCSQKHRQDTSACRPSSPQHIHQAEVLPCSRTPALPKKSSACRSSSIAAVQPRPCKGAAQMAPAIDGCLRGAQRKGQGVLHPRWHGTLHTCTAAPPANARGSRENKQVSRPVLCVLADVTSARYSRQRPTHSGWDFPSRRRVAGTVSSPLGRPAGSRNAALARLPKPKPSPRAFVNASLRLHRQSKASCCWGWVCHG
jgi:hypothetical protein